MPSSKGFQIQSAGREQKGDRGYFSPLNYSKRNDYVDTQENVSSEQFIISGYHKNEKNGRQFLTSIFYVTWLNQQDSLTREPFIRTRVKLTTTDKKELKKHHANFSHNSKGHSNFTLGVSFIVF